MSNPIERAIHQLRETVEGIEAADELEEFTGRLMTALREANYALYRSSEFAGLIADGDEEINAPWNIGGYGYEAHIMVMGLLDEMKGVKV